MILYDTPTDDLDPDDLVGYRGAGLIQNSGDINPPFSHYKKEEPHGDK